ncbi:hypothetical protein LTS18_006686 [Coniosporium uncinatum]|uniref:Uncharacterized protein n=1 Tax=Coniosporium uncinatum TaxID=93489 RepID=A0ACC3DQH1_9PEZI|nr:hypothetical protein LTS18_006686 [Coniosporium uncinatum]
MSVREIITLAHSAQCKLNLAADKRDRNLRFLVGHAMHLDALTLRLVEIEEGIDQPDHATGVKFKGAGNAVAAGGDHRPLHSPAVTRVRRSPPPAARDDDDDDDDVEDDDGDAEEDGLSLQRMPSGSTRHPQDVPALDPSDEDDSDSDDDDLLKDPAFLREITKGKGDEVLKELYGTVKGCPCQEHHATAPVVERMWELPGKEGQVGRRAVAEIRG